MVYANPIRILDFMGLIPMRKEAKRYRMEHNINGRVLNW